MRVVEEAQSNAPIGDGAGGVGLEGFLEDLPRRAVPERVLIAHAAIEPPLRDLVARGLETHRAETLVRVFLAQCRVTQENRGGCRNGERGPACCHDIVPSLSITRLQDEYAEKRCR